MHKGRKWKRKLGETNLTQLNTQCKEVLNHKNSKISDLVGGMPIFNTIVK